MLRTALTERWGLEVPIVQAPMAGVSGGLLAGAVSAAGGLGMIGVPPTTTTDWIAEQADIAREHGRFGIGLLLWAVADQPEQFEAALATRPFVLSLSFGDIAPYVQRAHDAGVLVVTQAQSARMAGYAMRNGADAVVVQGSEAGGHTGSVATLPLLQAVLDTGGPDALVLAAGGIASGRGVAGALAMGAAGAWMGTRFVATQEALGHGSAKQAVVDAAETDTVLTHVFDIVQGYGWPDEFPGRALANDFSARWHGNEAALTEVIEDERKRFEHARSNQDLSLAHVYAGQAIGAIHDVPAAGELVGRLARDAEDQLRRASRLLV